MFSLITHDLRNPLAALSSNAGYLKMVATEVSEDVGEAIEDLTLSIEALGRIIDSMELVGQDLKGSPVSPPAVVVVEAVVRSVQGQAERAAASHGVTLHLDLGAEAQTRFVADSLHFQRALSFLLHNSLTLAPERSTVTLRVLRDESDLAFRVEDSGPALAPELAQKAFSATGQFEVKSRRAARYSRGLGLYAVVRSAELAGVRLRVGENPDGSTLELLASLA